MTRRAPLPVVFWLALLLATVNGLVAFCVHPPAGFGILAVTLVVAAFAAWAERRT